MRKVLIGAAVIAALMVPTTTAVAGGGEIDDVRIVNLNLLHGLFCPKETNSCQAEDRVELLMRQLEAADCPDVVGLQEINAVLAKLLNEATPKVCDGEYTTVFGGKPSSADTERVMTTLPVKSKKSIKLVGGFRTASRVVLDSPVGPLVVVVTHQDGDPEGGPSGIPCKLCPPPCQEAGVGSLECQTVAAAVLAEDTGSNAIRVLMGDFNVTSTSARYMNLVADGWVDSHLAAGNPECDLTTSIGCTAGRDDDSLESLLDPSVRQAERIDFMFVKSPSRCDVTFDDAADADGDGLGTGVWNGEPTTDGPGGIAWTSDHTGTSADISCAKKGSG